MPLPASFASYGSSVTVFLLTAFPLDVEAQTWPRGGGIEGKYLHINWLVNPTPTPLQKKYQASVFMGNRIFASVGGGGSEDDIILNKIKLKVA